MFSDLAVGGSHRVVKNITREETRKKASGDPVKTGCEPKLEKRWVKRRDLARIRHSGVGGET